MCWTGFTYSRNIEWKNDESLWSATLKYHPENVKAAYHIAEISMSRKQYDKAEELYKKSVKLYPDHSWNPDKRSRADVYYKLGQVYQYKGENNKALDSYKESLNLNSEPNKANFAYYQLLGIEHAKTGKLDDAISLYNKALNFESNRTDIHHNLGLAYFKKKNYDKAKKEFEKAIEIDNSFVDAYVSLGSVYAKKGNYKKAVEYYEKAISADPDSEIAKKNLEMIRNFLK